MLLVKAAYEQQPRKFDCRMEQLAQISQKAYSWVQALPLEKWALPQNGRRRYGLWPATFLKSSTVFWKGLESAITACVQMTFYLVNDYFVRRIKETAVRISEGGPLSTQLSAKLLTYAIRANSYALRVLTSTRCRGSENRTPTSRLTREGRSSWLTFRTRFAHVRNHICMGNIARTC